MSSVGYYVSLFFLLTKFTRGNLGVRVVSAYVLEHWGLFVSDFHALCRELVKYCRAYIKEHGETSLAHREGRHGAYSGYHFLDTLVLKSCREALQATAQAMIHVFIFSKLFFVYGFFLYAHG